MFSTQAEPSALILLVYQREAGFLQGITLHHFVPPLQKFFRGTASSSVYGLRSGSQARPSTKFVRPQSRIFLFQGFPHLPFSLASLAVRVSRRWLSPFKRRALREGFPKTPSQASLSSISIPFPGLPEGGSFLSVMRFRSHQAFVSFRAADLSGRNFPRGILRSPHITLGNVAQRFRLVLQPCVPRGTHNYTLS